MPKDDDITKAPWYGKKPTDEKLKAILAKHKAWVEAGTKGDPPTDMRGIYLEGKDLRGVHLQEADLEKANLKGADLKGAHLEKANLEGADLEGADLTDTICEGTTLTNAVMQYADLYRTNFKNADLSGADLRGARLYKTIVENAKLFDVKFGGARFLGVDLSKAFTEKSPSFLPRKRITALKHIRSFNQASTSRKAVQSYRARPTKIAVASPKSREAILASDEKDHFIRNPAVQARLIKVIDRAAALGRNLFIPLILACGYIAVTSVKTKDGVSSDIILPIMQAEISESLFYIFSVFLLVSLQLYFLLQVHQLIFKVTFLEDVDLKGVSRSQIIDPWLALIVVKVLGPWNVEKPTLIDFIQFLLVLFIVWGPVPITLFIVWHSCLCRGEWLLTFLQLSGITVSLCLGALFFLKAGATLERWKLGPWKILTVLLCCALVGAVLTWASQERIAARITLFPEMTTPADSRQVWRAWPWADNPGN